MIPGYWTAGLPAYLWQVVLHSSVLGLIFYLWARQVRLRSGRTKRRLLAILVVMPLVTAAVPGRSALVFRGRTAWLDSGRVLAIPLIAGARIYHVVLLVAAMMTVVTIWQELAPLLRRRHRVIETNPVLLAEAARTLPAWGDCEVVVYRGDDVMVATAGWPSRPRLIVSTGAIERLNGDELAAAVRHEHAHWRQGRWLRSHALFLARLLQCQNPIALWAFREYCVELEIECDAAAVSGGDANQLARTLLKLYGLTDPRDAPARSTLRKRVEALIDPQGQIDDNALPPATIAVAAASMAVVLPWIV